MSIVLSIEIAGQNYPLAPEVWSEPVRVDSFSKKFDWESEPSLTANLDTMYFYLNNGIYRSILKDGIWQIPKRLNNNVNTGTPMSNPSISKDGRRIYYSSYAGYGSWDIWYNDWDNLSGDWGKAHNMGPQVNTESIDWYLYEVSKDTIYTLSHRVASPSPCLFVWDSSKSEWAIKDSFYYHPLASNSIQGMSITGDRKKLYFAETTWTDYYERRTELCVTYWDSITNNWSKNIFFLNINSRAFLPDSNNQFAWYGGAEIFPWISNNGKIMYFESNRDVAIEDTINTPDIYVSYLLIDENGNPVSVNPGNENLPTEYKLFQNYPNPFNSSTKIKYKTGKEGKVTLSIYDILGRRITELINKDIYPGEYEIEFNTDKYYMSSGTYICQLRINNISLTKKLILLK